ncbi:MAG: DsbA family protein [Patescibacteria group bacterium]|nr:DsbA family protein [Patescibacteria group bacterium]
MTEEKSNKSITITVKKDMLWKAGTFVFAALFLIGLFSGWFGGSGSDIRDIAPTGQATDTINAKALIEDDDPVLGDSNADVSIVEFSDFQCPFCGKAHTGALTDFKNSDYFKDGQVNLIYKHFPLNSIHPYAQKAGEASECANRQGKFWEYHDTLFANQAALDIVSLKSYATQLGLDTSEFNSCLDGGEASSEISKELAQATAAGGRGTPYFVVVNNKNGNAVPVSGAVPFAQLEAAINAVS